MKMWDWIADIEDMIQGLVGVILVCILFLIFISNVFGVTTVESKWITIPIESKPSIWSSLFFGLLLCITPMVSGLVRSIRRWIEDADISGTFL